MQSSNVKSRTVWSMVVIVVYAVIESFWRALLPQYQGINAAQNLNNDSPEGNALSLIFRAGDWATLALTLIVVFVLCSIWAKPIKAFVRKNNSVTALMLVAVMVVAFAGACNTNRATTDSEKNATQDVVVVQPNQTAFQIPTMGGSLSGQVELNSEAYYEKNRVAAKEILVDKQNTGGKFIPTTFVILVDRTPSARQWTGDPTTGTSGKNEGLCGETKESIEVCFQIGMSAQVEEKNSAKYLYHFPTTKLKDTQVGGVFLATSLDDVVDKQVRPYIIGLIGAAEAAETLDGVIAKKADIVSAAEKDTIKYWADQGITISYVRLGGQLIMDPKIQASINEKYAADQRIQIAMKDAQAIEERGKGDAKALALVTQASGGNAALVEAYRWNGDRTLARSGAAPTIPLTDK